MEKLYIDTSIRHYVEVLYDSARGVHEVAVRNSESLIST